jgi:DNA-binding CsgD family transcriptional regulator
MRPKNSTMASTKSRPRHAGIQVWHRSGCASRSGRTCNCRPAYRAEVWSARDEKKIRKTFTSLVEAKAWRADALGELRRGSLRAPSAMTLAEVGRRGSPATATARSATAPATLQAVCASCSRTRRPAEIVRAIELVHAGDAMLSPTVTRRLIAMVAGDSDAGHRADQARELLATLSPRERDVAIAIGEGHGNAEIAAALHLSVATVKGHVSRLFDKLEVDNRVQIALLVQATGGRSGGR